jgi:hypothetical protein
MPPSRSVAMLFALTAVVQACATSQPFDRTTEPGGKPVPMRTAGAVILTGDALSADPGRTVLEAIRRVMPQLRVTSWSQVNRCPRVELRGRDSMSGSSDPDVYVDGTRTADTCPLVTLQASDTRLIEVSPSGVTSRPGYPSTGHGLILIFLQRADTTGSNR